MPDDRDNDKRGDGPALVGANTSLTTDTNGGTANAEMVNSAGDSTRRRRHDTTVVMEVGDNQSG